MSSVFSFIFLVRISRASLLCASLVRIPVRSIVRTPLAVRLVLVPKSYSFARRTLAFVGSSSKVGLSPLRPTSPAISSSLFLIQLWDFVISKMEIMPFNSLLSLPAIIFAFLVTYYVYAAQVLRLKARKHGCQPAPRYKHKDRIFGLDLFLRTGDAITNNRFLEEHQRRYDTYGHTFEALNFGSRAIYSVHPDNIRAVWSKNAADWGIQPLRSHNMRPFCGSGFITTDGEEWKRSHALLKPGFHKSNISDFTHLENNLQAMLEQVPKDGTKFDLQPWVIKLVGRFFAPQI
jgi:hypothetical protein